MVGMIRFYRDVLGFEIKEAEDTGNVYLVKDGTLFLLYGRKDFEKMTNHQYDYIKGLNEASVVWVGTKWEMGNICQGRALAPLGYPKALWRKAVKAAIGEA